MSDTLQVNAYFSGSPIAISGVYDVDRIVVENLNQPIVIKMPYRVDMNDNKD